MSSSVSKQASDRDSSDCRASRETVRQERWHEIYRLVLEKQLTQATYNPYIGTIGGGSVVVLDVEGAHKRAKAIADAAYPPPERP